MRLKGAIFDMDGTLLDSMPLWNRRGSDFERENGLEPEPDIDKRFKVMSLRQSAEYFHDVCHVPGTVEDIIDRINACVERGYKTVLPKPAAREFLEYLRANGVKLYIATATERYLVEGVLTRLDLLKYFEGLVTCGEAGYGKSRPDVFDRALAIIGTAKSETAIFEDAPHAIRTAKAAGYYTVCIEDASYLDVQEELQSLSDVYVKDFRELVGKFDLPAEE